MSNATLTRSTSVPQWDVRPSSTLHPASAPVRAVPGSYTDVDGVRRARRVVGSYTGTASTEGAYAGRAPREVGSYVRSAPTV